ADLKLEYIDDKLPTLLYWFSPTCGWCKVNLPNFEALAAQAQGRYRFVPVSTASTTELTAYSSSKLIRFPLYSITPTSKRQYRLLGTPTTLLISPRGVVTKKWIGAYNPKEVVDLERTLSVKLPGKTVTATTIH